MKVTLNYTAIILLLFQFITSHSQINYSGKPLFNSSTDSLFIPVIELNIDNIAKKKINNSNTDLHFKVDEFATTVAVSINTEDYGVWYEYREQNKKVWLIRIKSDKALSINVLFDKFRLVPDVKVFLYNKKQSHILGALSHRNNKLWNELATTPINGDEVFIELQTPLNIEYFGEFNIGQIGIEKGKGEQLKSTQDEWFGSSAACHINVNCFNSTNIQKQKNAVCRIIYRGSSRCTGTLLNNLNNDRIPYIITAAHCFTTDFIANKAVFNFNYESPNCENIDTIPQSISGASVVSFSENLDFVLLRLSENIPDEYEPYYSGWDARGLAPQMSFVLHHPEGDIQKISIDEDEAVTDSWGNFDKNTHWKIADYEIGSSEAGSSGGGLISEENYLVGTLTGGGETCTDNILDYYQKFSHSYSDYPAPENQLKAWLDPNSTNKLTCNAYNGSSAFRNSAQILTNISAGDIIETKIQPYEWGYLSGHNYQNNTLFAEHFQLNGSKYLYGANIYIADFFGELSSPNSVVFTIWAGGDEPREVIYEKPISYSEIKDEIDGLLYKIDFDSTILVHNSVYFGYQISYESDTFAVKTVSVEPNNNSAFTYINNEWRALQLNRRDYSSKLALEVLAFDYLPNKETIPDTVLIRDIHIYPNPCNNQFQVLFKNGIDGKVAFKIFDLNGRIVYMKEWLEPNPNIPVEHNLPKGVYILNVLKNGYRIEVRKIIVF